ncbi:MAG TPA: ribose 5-phosphate isomerase B [Clostridiaceae bacterium]|nr:ribose 5-phosphate isomerase B [Clostridiaceae bacterium]
MKIAVASDHGGYELKEKIKQHLIERGHEVTDVGTYSTTSVSYVDFGHQACEKINDGLCERAILVCGTGIGMSVVANKHKGIRAALCTNTFMVDMARRHNDANVLVLGARVLAIPYAIMLVDIFMSEPFDGGRHQERLNQITKLEEKICD